MAKFAQYYFLFSNNGMAHDWDDRQKDLGKLFENDDSIEFSTGKDEDKKVYKHQVYHLQNNNKIIVMRFANSIDIPYEKDFDRTQKLKDEPSCFVIIDNRDNLRSVAIQRRKKAFGNPDQVARILRDIIDAKLYQDHCYKTDIKPVYYPEDLFKAWEQLQQHTCSLRVGFPDLEKDEIVKMVNELKEKGKEYFDDSLMESILQLALEGRKAKYNQVYTIMPEEKKTALYLDKSSVYMRNIITLCRATNQPLELVTSDSGSFRCFVECDEDNTDKIVNKEFDDKLLEKLFAKGNINESENIVEIEGKVLEMMNSMKQQSQDIKENIA